jgi:hypothetical protein
MISRTPTLAEWPDRMRLACDLCPRRGQYRKETLVARFGGDVLMLPAFVPNGTNHELIAKDLTEGRFRSHWEKTNPDHNDCQRFGEVLKRLQEVYGPQRPSIYDDLINEFGDIRLLPMA